MDEEIDWSAFGDIEDTNENIDWSGFQEPTTNHLGEDTDAVTPIATTTTKTPSKYEPKAIEEAVDLFELGEDESIDKNLLRIINQIEEARVKYPHMGATYDLAISNARVGAQRKKDNLVKEKIARLENNQRLLEIEENRSTPLGRTLKSAKVVGLGMLKLPVGILRGGEALTDYAGLTDEETTLWRDYAKKNAKIIKDEGLEAEAFLGELISSGGALGAVAKKIVITSVVKLSTMVGAEAATITAGEGKGAVDIVQSGATGFVGGVVLGGAIKGAVKLYSSSKNYSKTTMDKMLEKMSPDQRRATNEVLDVLDKSNIKKMNEQARDTIIKKIDFTKPSDEISIALKHEIDSAKRVSRLKYDTLYKKAVDTGSKSKPIFTGSIYKSIKKRDKGKYTEDENKIMDAIAIKIKNANEKNASDVEITLKDIFSIKANPTPSEKRILEHYRDALKSKQEIALGEKNKGVFEQARSAWTTHQKQFTGRIDGKEGIGAKLGKIYTTEQKSDIATDILGLSINSKAVNGLEALNLSPKIKMDIVKNFISKGIEKDRLNTPAGVKAIISNINKIDPETLGKFVGAPQAKRLFSEMRALATVQDIVSKSGNIHDNLMDDLSKFVVSAGLLKVSPVYGTKGMLESAKRIFKDTNILPKDVLIARTKTIENKALKNRILSLIHMTGGSKVSAEYMKLGVD